MTGITLKREEGEPTVPPPSTLFIYDAPKKRFMEFKSHKDTIYIWCDGADLDRYTFIIKLKPEPLEEFKWELLRGDEVMERRFFDSLEECMEVIGKFCDETKK